MLTKLENAYLYILRVVVLIAATLALLGVVLGLGRTATLIADFVTVKSPTSEAPGGSLRDYVDEKRPQGVTVDSSPGGPPPVADAPPSIQAAANSITRYVSSRDGVSADRSQVIAGLMSKRSDMPDELQDQYSDSLAGLMAELDHSKGTPLSPAQIGDLIDWHASKFKANAEAIAAHKQRSQLQAMQTLGVAAAGFGGFIALVFCFLIVKIERNLRLVHMVSETGPPLKTV